MSDEDAADESESPKSRPEAAHQQPSAADAAPNTLGEALEPPPDAGEAEVYQQKARLAEDRLAEVLGAYRTLKKESEAHRDRLTRNIERRYDQRRERLLLKFIDILDNLDRALEAAESTYAGEPLIEGLILVRTQLLQTLQEEGLERIPVLGLPYDPHFSEAVETRIVEDPDHHHVVVKELLRGYRLNGRIARASRVVVGECPGAATEAEAAGAEGAAPEAAAEETAEADDITPPPPPPSAGPAELPRAPGEEGPSIEDIVSRAEAQEALFPSAFEGDAPEKETKKRKRK